MRESEDIIWHFNHAILCFFRFFIPVEWAKSDLKLLQYKNRLRNLKGFFSHLNTTFRLIIKPGKYTYADTIARRFVCPVIGHKENIMKSGVYCKRCTKHIKEISEKEFQQIERERKLRRILKSK